MTVTHHMDHGVNKYGNNGNKQQKFGKKSKEQAASNKFRAIKAR